MVNDGAMVSMLRYMSFSRFYLRLSSTSEDAHWTLPLDVWVEVP